MDTKPVAQGQVEPQHAVLSMWAIKHTPSGAFLPRGRGGRGGTRVEIGDGGPPRLFRSESAAKVALHCWLAGPITVGRTHYGDPWDGYECDEDWHVEPAPHRVAADMQIVPVTIAERSA